MRLAFHAAMGYVRTLGICAALMLSARLASAENVAVVLSEETPTYIEIADHLRRMVDRQNVKGAKLMTIPARRLAGGEKGILKTDFYQLIVTVGAHAANLVAKQDVKVPVLNTLIPRALYDRISARGITGGQSSAIYLDQPHARQLELARIVLRGRSRLCVIYGPESKLHGAEFERIATVKGFSVVAETVNRTSDLGPTLQRSLTRCEFLFALPDAEVFNRNTIQQVLLTSYHSHDPVIAFSAAHVRSGALAAVFSSPEQIARQAAEALMKVRTDGKLPPPQYPTYWSVNVNRPVARLFGLEISTDKEIQAQLGLAEELK